ncbi:MAG: transposase, partial [Gammaproteobacteria bacterium]
MASLEMHIPWPLCVTKYRKKCITKSMLLKLEEILNQLCEQWECRLLEFNGETDHVHLLL